MQVEVGLLEACAPENDCMSGLSIAESNHIKLHEWLIHCHYQIIIISYGM